MTDYLMPSIAWYFITGFFSIVGALILVAVISPISIIPIIFVLVYCGKVMLTYLGFSIQIAKLTRVSRSPLVSSL